MAIRLTRRRRALLGLLVVLVVGLAVAPCITDREDRKLDDSARASFKAKGHSFVKLDRGTTHYEIAGPERGPLVVLIHGTSGPMTVWDETMVPLAEAGHRVLRFDAFGRGLSDRIDATYDLDLFVQQLEELTDALAPGEPMTLIGSSLGGIIAAAMASKHTQRVRAVVLVGPGGFPLQATILARLSRAPWIGDYLMRLVGDRKLVEHHRLYFVEPARFEARHEAFAQQLRYEGSKAAILSTLRHAPLQSYVEEYRQFGALGVPTLLVWGKDDATFPFANHETLLEAVPHAKLISVDGAAHLPMLEKPEEVHTEMLRFLSTFL